MRRLALIPITLALLPGCFLRIDADRHDDDHDWEDPFQPGDPSDDTATFDSGDDETPRLEVSILFDPHRVDAGVTTLLLAELEGADAHDLVALDLGPNIAIEAWRVLDDDALAVTITPDADARGWRAALLDFGDLGVGVQDDAIRILPAEQPPPEDTHDGDTGCAE